MAEIIGVTFKSGGKVYYFDPGKGKYEKGVGVVVETARGTEYATVVIPRTEMPDEKISSPLKPVIRAATPRDEEAHRKSIERRAGAFKTVREKIEKHGLDMKLIDCEFAFDGSKAVSRALCRGKLYFQIQNPARSLRLHTRTRYITDKNTKP